MLWLIIPAGLSLAPLLLTDLRQHVVDFLPFLILLACPLMHLFMHHGHGARPHDGRPG
jgi:hypothetical protein